MTRPGQDELRQLVITSAVQQRARQRSGKSLLGGLIGLLALIVFGVLLTFVFSAGHPNDNSAPTCDGSVMSPGDECDQYTNGALTGTLSYDDMLDQQHNGDPIGRVVGWLFIGAGVVGLVPVLLNNNPRAPWGKPVQALCPRCGQAGLREKKASATRHLGGRKRLTTTGIVTLCRDDCGFSAVRHPKAKRASPAH